MDPRASFLEAEGIPQGDPVEKRDEFVVTVFAFPNDAKNKIQFGGRIKGEGMHRL